MQKVELMRLVGTVPQWPLMATDLSIMMSCPSPRMEHVDKRFNRPNLSELSISSHFSGIIARRKEDKLPEQNSKYVLRV